MLKQKQLIAEHKWYFDTNLLKWVAKNSLKLHERFARTFPLARNKFHIQLIDVVGVKRTLVWKQDGSTIVSWSNSYHNTLPWSVIRKMGAPSVK